MKYLLAIDGSPAALQAVRWALRQASEGLACQYVLVNVQEPPTLYEVVTAHDAGTIDEVRAAAGADLLREAEALLTAAGVDWESEVAGGSPGVLITELAENYACDAIVVGAQGAGAEPGSGLGQVVLDVLARATMPVTVVPVPEAEAASAV